MCTASVTFQVLYGEDKQKLNVAVLSFLCLVNGENLGRRMWEENGPSDNWFFLMTVESNGQEQSQKTLRTSGRGQKMILRLLLLRLFLYLLLLSVRWILHRSSIQKTSLLCKVGTLHGGEAKAICLLKDLLTNPQNGWWRPLAEPADPKVKCV